MTILLGFYVFVFGLVLGSFLNVVGLRIPQKQSLISPPSTCGRCGTRLQTRDLIPVVSYLISKGRCRHCQSAVSWVYPAGELATGLLFLGAYMRFGWSWDMLLGLILVCLCVAITVSDLKYMLIPNKILLFVLPIIIILRSAVLNEVSWWYYPLGALCGFGTILLVILVSRGGMGLGDAKLLFVCGWALGPSNVMLAFLLACLVGSLVGGTLLLLKLIDRKQPIPFGPYLAFGTLAAYGYGSNIIDAYWTLIGL